MQLANYLKQFKNIAWYPSACKDTMPMVCLSFNNLIQCGISKEDIPDCFIFTDYRTYSEYKDGGRFELDLDEKQNETAFNYENADYKATVHNVKKLGNLNVGFDQSLVEFECDNYYGSVFVGDVLIEHQIAGKIISKLIYVVVENTSFAFDFLIKKNIKVKYVIHSRYGHGFGGGISNGGFLCNILQDLETKYVVSDMKEGYNNDLADDYLTGKQRKNLPILKKIINFYDSYGWCGYDDTILYKVVGYKRIDNLNGFNTRFLMDEGEMNNYERHLK